MVEECKSDFKEQEKQDKVPKTLDEREKKQVFYEIIS
jgi:hypothetical protein